ncbi:hypothetical protein A4G20_07865 [Pasteurellaceae bacterium RH1A]|nr:hypothetical protein A4G20_07865 [Pasteurellaceae bacterium RH1A]
MPKAVRLTSKARSNIQEILQNVVEFTGWASSGEKLLREFQEQFDLIGFVPKAGKAGIIAGTREVFCRSYRIVYREYDEFVEITTILHSRRKYP